MDATLAKELELELREVPVLDPHTHLVGGRLGARGLHDILLYHMVISDLYAAGCPAGHRLTPYPAWPSDLEARTRIEESLPFLPRILNTSSFWGVRLILRDLYGWEQPITPDNWTRLDALIRERADDRAWHHSLWEQMGIQRTGTEWARRGTGADDKRLVYALEWGFFTRSQWGEYDTALYELERCWGRAPESPSPIGSGGRPAPERQVRTLADVHAALDHYVEGIPREVWAMATHLSTDIAYRLVTEVEMSRALERRAQAGPSERDTYASYVHESLLNKLAGLGLIFQFSLGAEPLPFETGSRLAQCTVAQLAEMLGRHSNVQFQCFLASRHGNQSLCTLARELPNLSLAGYWWHNFFPGIIRQVMDERLDMLPLNRQIGFFSDAYCLEWVYAKLSIVRHELAAVLAERVERGQYSRGEALVVARALLYDTPRQWLGIQSREGAGDGREHPEGVAD